jgi:aminopeptidase N
MSRNNHTDLLQYHPFEGSTYANPQDFITKHIHLDWLVDFKKSIITGYIDLTMEITKNEQLDTILRQIESKGIIEKWNSNLNIESLYNVVVDELLMNSTQSNLYLDTRNLDISKVILKGKEDLPLKYSLGNTHFSYGEKLTIELDSVFKVASVSQVNNIRKTIVKKYIATQGYSIDEEFTIRIYYSTKPECTAAQWLPPSQTADGVHSYLFTQCQSIYARSLFPCQDNPAIKATYSCTLRVPKGYTGLMSAVEVSPPILESYNGEEVMMSKWEQRVPISSYLIVVVVGNLTSRDLSPRCRIWSEPEFIDACAYEFEQVDSFITAAEKVCGSPYSWGRYDMWYVPLPFPDSSFLLCLFN